MAIKTIRATVTGINPLLQNNPQMADPLNAYKKAMSKVTAKKKKTDEDYGKISNIEMRAKMYWDDGIVIPTNWLLAAIHSISFKKAKIAKKDSRSGLFTVNPTAKLHYAGMKKVKTPEDIVKNAEFKHNMLVKQGQVKVAKSYPIFHDWSFEVELEYDDSIFDAEILEDLIQHSAKYGGFGDFRPTFGRATAEVEHVS